MRIILLYILLAASPIALFAQEANVLDSLMNVLKTAKEDSNKAILLLSIGEQYERAAPETSKYYYHQSLDLSKKINYALGEIKFASYYTAVLNMQGRFDSSLQLNKEALQLARKLKNDLAIAKMSFNTANSFYMLSKNDSAIYYYMQVLPVLDKLGDKQMLGTAYSNLQNFYLELSQYEKAIEYGKKGLEIYKHDFNGSLQHAYCLSNLGTVYSTLKKYDTALIYLNEALQISRKLGDFYTESTVLLNLGDLSFKLNRLEDSKLQFDRSLEIAKEMDLSETETIAMKGLAMYYLEKKNYLLARQFADSALGVATKNNIRKQKLKIYNLLSDISYANQDLSAAHKFEEMEDLLRDSIHNDNLQQLSTEYETKYETEKKENIIQIQQSQLRQKSTLIYSLIAGVVALMVITFLTYRNYKNKQKLQQAKIDELETEKQLTATEGVLKGEEQERTRLAKDLHDGLGGMLSGIKYSLGNVKENLIMTPENAQAFERSIDMLDSSIREMRRVAHNLMPEILVKYGLDSALNEYCNEIDLSGVLYVSYHSINLNKEKLDLTSSVTIYRIIQELINNAMKHASAKNILVQVHVLQSEKLLTITVEDDGKGFDITTLSTTKGMGWSNIQNRVEFLKGKTDISSAPGKGTSILIEISI
ncbi:MAG: sensor histidine kinase [Bacteroidetes bacterium]|nr:sensor histidine kinase [Bacteroidota bacterium]